MLSFGARLSATFFRNRGNTFKGSTPREDAGGVDALIKIEKMQEDRRSKGQRIAPRLIETRQ